MSFLQCGAKTGIKQRQAALGTVRDPHGKLGRAEEPEDLVQGKLWHMWRAGHSGAGGCCLDGGPPLPAAGGLKLLWELHMPAPQLIYP